MNTSIFELRFKDLLSDLALKHLEDTKRDLLKDLESQRTRYETVTSELDMLQVNFETSTKNIAVLEANIKEMSLTRDEIRSVMLGGEGKVMGSGWEKE